ncbi:unnamed protein product [Urochloa humidicola]
MSTGFNFEGMEGLWNKQSDIFNFAEQQWIYSYLFNGVLLIPDSSTVINNGVVQNADLGVDNASRRGSGHG